MLRADEGRPPSHGFPDPKGNGIHIEKPDLVAPFASLAVNADLGQKLRLPGTDQVRPHTDGGSILKILHFL